MKIKNLLRIVLKLLGLIALWHAIKAFPTIVTGVGIITSSVSNTFMFFIAFAMLLNFVVPLVVALLFLFKTEGLLSVLKLDEIKDAELKTDRSLLMFALVIFLGVFVLIHGTGNFINTSYNSSTNTHYTTNNSQSGAKKTSEKITENKSSSTTVNYFSLVEIVLGGLVLVKSSRMASFLEAKLDDEPDTQKGEKELS